MTYSEEPTTSRSSQRVRAFGGDVNARGTQMTPPRASARVDQ